jgi:signal transduction histidine kinase
MKMTRKFLLVVILILIFPTLAIHQGTVQYSERVMKNNIIENNEIMAELIVNRVNSEISDVVSQLQLVAGMSDLHQLDLQSMYNRAKQAISKSTVIQSIYFLDRQKRMKFEAPFRPEIDDLAYEYPLYEHVNWSYTYVVSGLITNARSEKTVTVAIPVFYESREIQGVLVAELSRNFLSNILRSTSETREGFSFIIDDSGQVIASTRDEEWNLDFSQEPVVKLLLKGDSGSVQDAYQGKPSVMTYQTMRENWGLALGVPEDVAFQPVRTLSKGLTISFAGLIVLMIVLTLIGGRQLVVPILKLTRFAQRIQSRRALPKLPESFVKRKDEIGELIRALMEMNHRVEQSRRFLQDIIEGIPYALITLNEKGEVTHVNLKWAELFGGSVTDWGGVRLQERAEFGFLTARAEDKEVIWHDQQGVSHVLRVVTAPFHEGILAVVQDITQIRMLESHVKQSEQLALIGQITAGIAHELKNPLAVLASSSELLKDELAGAPDSEWVPTLARDIDEEIQRMTVIVNDFLTLARSRKDQTGPVKLHQILDRVLHLLRIKFNEVDVKVERHYAPDLPEIEGSGNRLIQVFLNLLVNSLEAMPGGGTIRIRTYRTESEAVVEIADEGEGISEEHLKWLFNPFFSTKEKGNGLGLSIARDIMLEHSGSLDIQSELRKGTVVTCRFPIKKKEGIA